MQEMVFQGFQTFSGGEFPQIAVVMHPLWKTSNPPLTNQSRSSPVGQSVALESQECYWNSSRSIDTSVFLIPHAYHLQYGEFTHVRLWCQDDGYQYNDINPIT
jgi:hypothetical protein